MHDHRLEDQCSGTSGSGGYGYMRAPGGQTITISTARGGTRTSVPRRWIRKNPRLAPCIAGRAMREV
eukprot:8154204-Pyramimonas_sp.AAC.1